MTTIPFNPTEVSALRKEMGLYGIKIDQQQAWTLLRAVCNHGGNRGICVDALLQDPRPAWVEQIAGPLIALKKGAKK